MRRISFAVLEQIETMSVYKYLVNTSSPVSVGNDSQIDGQTLGSSLIQNSNIGVQ